MDLKYFGQRCYGCMDGQGHWFGQVGERGI